MWFTLPGSQHGGVCRALCELHMSLAAAFLLLYLAVGNPVPAAHLYGNTHPPPASVAALPTDDPQAAAEQQRQDRRELLAVLGAVQLTRPQAAVRVAFFLWVSLLNLVAVASLWARSADVFSPEAAGRLFGLLGAGATLGQLLGSLAAGALARAPQLGGGGGSPSLLPLLLSAAAFELGGQAAGRYRGVKGASSQQPEIEEGGGAEAEAMVRHASSSSLIAPLQGSSSSGKMVRATSRGVMAITIGREFPAGGGTDLPDGATNVRARAAGSKGSSGGRRRPSKDGSFLGQLLVRTLEGYRLIRCGLELVSEVLCSESWAAAGVKLSRNAYAAPPRAPAPPLANCTLLTAGTLCAFQGFAVPHACVRLPGPELHHQQLFLL